MLSIASFLVWALLVDAASPAVSVALLALPLVIIAGFYRVWRNQALKKARALVSSIAQEVSSAA